MASLHWLRQTFRFLRCWLRDWRAPRTAQVARMQLEPLEDRCVTAVLSAVVEPPLLPEVEEWGEELTPDIEVDWSTDAEIPENWEFGGDDWELSVGENPDIWLNDTTQDQTRNISSAPFGDGGQSPDPISYPTVSALTPFEPSTPITESGNPLTTAAPRADVAGVTATVAPVGTDGTANAFRLSRAAGADTPLEVHVSVSAYSSSAVVSRAFTVVIPAGASHVDLPIPVSSSNALPEILTLTIRSKDQHEAGPTTATLFPSGKPRECSEEALLQAYQREHSPEAFSALVERHRPGVLRTSYRILGNWDDAEDVGQGVFLALARLQLRLHVPLAGWLSTVARNAAIVFLRARSRRQRHEERAAQPVQVDPDEAGRDLREELDVALSRIPAALGEAVRLRYLEGLSQREAAEVVGCPRGTLSQRAAHGVRCLREVLSKG